MTNRFKTLLLVTATALSVAACTPTQATRGNIVEDHRMAEIKAGESSKTDVLRNLGSPTTQAPFDDNVWYYIGQKTEKSGIFDPEVVEEKIVVVAFSEEGMVQQIEELDSNRVDIPIVRRKTPTGGHEVTIMQQLLGNIGRFSAPESSAAGTAGR